MVHKKTIETVEASCDFCGSEIPVAVLNNIPCRDGKYEKTTLVIVTEIGDKKTNHGTLSGVMCPECRKLLVKWGNTNAAMQRIQ